MTMSLSSRSRSTSASATTIPRPTTSPSARRLGCVVVIPSISSSDGERTIRRERGRVGIVCVGGRMTGHHPDTRLETDVDVLIVGAGVSGIGAACHLQSRHPGRSLAILEARETIGGTWDLFRFPGVRSDSDVHTLAYAFRPWTGDRAIVDGATIRRYVEDTAREH